MFEGKNEIKFSKITAQKIIGKYLTELFGVPIEVISVDTGSYKESIDVEFNEIPPEPAKATLYSP